MNDHFDKCFDLKNFGKFKMSQLFGNQIALLANELFLKMCAVIVELSNEMKMVHYLRRNYKFYINSCSILFSKSYEHNVIIFSV